MTVCYVGGPLDGDRHVGPGVPHVYCHEHVEVPAPPVGDDVPMTCPASRVGSYLLEKWSSPSRGISWHQYTWQGWGSSHVLVPDDV